MSAVNPDEWASSAALMVDERGQRVPNYSPICQNCRHYSWGTFRRCSAFPDGVPLPIWRGQHDHQAPFDGDSGVRFALMIAEDERALDDWLAERRRAWSDVGSRSLDAVGVSSSDRGAA